MLSSPLEEDHPLSFLLPPILEGVLEASARIRELRTWGDLSPSLKGDRTPVTKSDLESDRILRKALQRCAPSTPIISEETSPPPYEERKGWEEFFLVDPLDGTRDFLEGGEEYSINIALVRKGQPILGVIHEPSREITYVGIVGVGAWRRVGGVWEPLEAEDSVPPPPILRVLVSRTRFNEETRKFLLRLPSHIVVPLSSSLKFCRIAEGEAHLFIRFGPTWEWDTAAGVALLCAAGGSCVDPRRNSPLTYNSPDLSHPALLATRLSLPLWEEPSP